MSEADLYDDFLVNTPPDVPSMSVVVPGEEDVVLDVVKTSLCREVTAVDPRPSATISAAEVVRCFIKDAFAVPNHRYPVYVGNLSWWTSDRELTDTIAGLGVEDLLEIKFHEHRVSGQSKGYATVTLGSDYSVERVLDGLPKIRLHGLDPVVSRCTKTALKHLESIAQARFEPRVLILHDVPDETTEVPPGVVSTLPFGASVPVLPFPVIPSGFPGPFGPPCLLPPVGPPTDPLGCPPLLLPGPGNLPLGPPFFDDPFQSIPFDGFPPSPITPEWRPPPRPHVNPLFLARLPNGDTSFRPPPLMEPFPEGNGRSPTPEIKSAENSDRMLVTNQRIAYNATSRAVKDASTGKYASAIETLVTAISFLKRSSVGEDDRCKIMVSNLQELLRGIEARSYDDREKEKTEDKSPPPSPEHDRHKRSKRSREEKEKHRCSRNRPEKRCRHERR